VGGADAARPCTIRRAGRDDLLDVLGVQARSDESMQAPRTASELELTTWACMMATEGLTVYLAEVEGEAVASATLLLMPNLTYGCAPTAFVEGVVVVVAHRRQGVATTLLRRVLEDTRRAGCNKIQILSHKRHATDGAHRLYTALGFEPEAEGFRLYQREVPASVLAARAPDS
jgi:GNAT superfamily N-acetyltransferase